MPSAFPEVSEAEPPDRLLRWPSHSLHIAPRTLVHEGPQRDRLKPIVDKVTLDRLLDRDLQLSFLCPYCKTSRILLDAAHSTGSLNGVDCPKCGAHILLDSVSVVVIKNSGTPNGAVTGRTP